MKLNFNADLLNVEGDPIKNKNGENLRLNGVLASSIMGSTSKENVVKFFDWAIKLQQEGVLDLDKADQALLKTTIENLDGITVLGKGRLLEVFDKREEELKKAV